MTQRQRTRPQAIIFDFDYTLADSSAGIIDCIQTAQTDMGLLLSTAEQIRRTIGLSVPEILTTLSGRQHSHRVDEFRQRFQARADQVMADNTTIYEGVPSMLRALAGHGIHSAIASTKFRYRIEQILQRDGLADLVHTVIGAEDVTLHKPDPACLLKALEKLAVNARDAFYVGDSLPDAEAAKRASIDFVAVLSGTTRSAEFASFGPVAVLDDVSALTGWMTTMNGRGSQQDHD
ncbi:MAG: HAD-IA family hydrolase [bacterium]|nr:HAD-IA family hydrolase [bacterium]